MNITKEVTGELTATLKLEIAEADYATIYQSELKKFARQANIPGFRPGKVPVGMIEKRYGTSVLMEQINKLINEELNTYVKNENLTLLGEPIPNTDKENASIENQKDFVFYFDIAQSPKFEIELSDKIELNYYRIQPDEDQINKVIENERERLSKPQEAEQVEKGDMVEFDLRQLNSEGKLIDENTFIASRLLLNDKVSEDALTLLIGKKVNDVLTVNVAELFGSAEKAAKEMGVDPKKLEENLFMYQMKITFVERYVKADVNQELFDAMFPGKGLTTEEELRKEVTGQIQKYTETESLALLYDDAMEKLTESANIQLPDDFLKRWLHFINEGKFTPEDIERDYEHVKNLLVTEMIERELINKYPELVITDDMIKKGIKDQVSGYFNLNMQIPEDEVDKISERFAANWLKDEKNQEEIKKNHRDLFRRKLADLLRSKVILNEKNVTTDEFYQIFAEKYKPKSEPASTQDEADHQHEDDHEQHDHTKESAEKE
ncbi:MAG TPA: trigger factor [Bacteroidales bacterium]|nr:trigger factor [Bacteroidales bacterium]